MALRKNLELITIGNELLLGRTANRHLSYLGEYLFRFGLAIQRSVVVADCLETIAKELRECFRRSDLVLATGGLGPTSDDCTREAASRAFGRVLVRDPEAEEALVAYFERRGRPVVESTLRQAWKPEGAEWIPNRYGTARGLWLEEKGKVLILLPGPPGELCPMVEEEVVPRLRERNLLGEEPPFIEISAMGAGESMFERTIRPILEREGEGIEVAYRVHDALVDCRLTARDGALSRERLEAVAEECASALGDDFVGFGCGQLSQIVAEQLREREQMLAVAESCTGGLLASCFTDIPGASKTFAGGVVAYNNAAKVELLGIPECFLAQHGAVSAENAVAMATAVAERLLAEYALSITGFAGPEGGDRENPVGTIYLGLYTPQGSWSRKVNYQGSRTMVKRRAVNAALDWLRRELAKPSPALRSADGPPSR